MANVTLSIEDDDLKQARIRALQEGTSLNAVMRAFVKDYVNGKKRYQQVTQRLLERAERSGFQSSDEPVSRESLYER